MCAKKCPPFNNELSRTPASKISIPTFYYYSLYLLPTVATTYYLLTIYIIVSIYIKLNTEMIIIIIDDKHKLIAEAPITATLLS